MNLKIRTRVATSVALAMLYCSSANADLTFNGFASFVAGKYSEDDASYLGYDNDVSFSPDTMIALQVGSQLNDEVSITTQFVAKGYNDYDLEVELAYLTYKIQGNWDARIGRIRAPFFYYSDFLDVGVAYPWISPPEEVYRMPFTSFDGVDTLYRGVHGDWSSTWQLFYGSISEDLELAGQTLTVEGDDLMGINVTIGNDWVTFRAGYVQGDVSQEIPDAMALYFATLSGAGFGTLAAHLDPRTDNTANYAAIAAIVDYNDWLMNVEYTSISWDRPSFVYNDSAWFVMLGRRFGDITAHITYANREDDPEFEANTIPTGIAPQLDQLSAILDSFYQNDSVSTITVGVRYDVDASIAVKLDVTNMDNEVAEPLYVGQPDPQEDGVLVRFGVDVVF